MVTNRDQTKEVQSVYKVNFQKLKVKTERDFKSHFQIM